MEKSKKDYDFCGYATKHNIRCSDGKIISPNAFIDNDGKKVPLVWNHQHDSVDNVLGHAYLENRKDGVYAYCKLNETEAGETAKSLVHNGDIDKLSIYANKLKVQASNVIHGCIREVSLVLAGANPGAYIEDVVVHSDNGSAEEVIIFTDECISHNDKEEKKMEETKKTPTDVFNDMTEEQKVAVYAIVGQAVEKQKENDQENSKEDKEDSKEDKEDSKEDKEDSKEDSKEDQEENKKDEGEEDMKHNVFEKENKKNEGVLMHSEILNEALTGTFKGVENYRSLKEAVANIAIKHAAIENVTDIGKLFPDDTELYKQPHMIENDQSWVSKIMKKTSHTPFSRVKATFGRMSETEARAKGYVKGSQKTDIKMAILNRVTTPTTIYIKNEIDRDDVVDITDFDVIAWQKVNMRKQLDKDIALSILFGDGRNVSSPDKINEQNVRPIMSDADMYTIKYTVTEGVDYKNPLNSASENDSIAKGVIRAAIKSRKNYKGTGVPSFITTEDMLTEMLLIEDQNGRLIYDSVEKLTRVLRCDEIITIPEMDNYTTIYALITCLKDYTVGADKGGNVSMFDDFDIDFNQMKYLMETRISGAITVPYSSIALLKKVAEVEPDPDPAG